MNLKPQKKKVYNVQLFNMKIAIERIGDAENTGPIRGAWIRLFPVLKMIHRVLQFPPNSVQSTNCNNNNNNKKERDLISSTHHCFTHAVTAQRNIEYRTIKRVSDLLGIQQI